MMNDELIEQINQIRHMLEETASEYETIFGEVSLKEKSKLEKHTTCLKEFSAELYKMFI